MKPRFILPLLLSVVAMAQPAGTFTATGHMTTPRFLHTATLLPNGKVLIAGGGVDNSGSHSASAELYDPSTRTFARTGDMTTARGWHTAVLLPNGKVLIAGGANPPAGNARTRSAELYDPSTGTFTATGDMVAESPAFGPGGRAHAVLLANGKVFYATELYDPITATFSAAADPFWGDVDTLLDDGRVLLANNFGASLYDPTSDTTRVTGAPDPNLLYEDAIAGAPLTNGKVLLTGGYFEELNTFSAGAELYDPLTGTFARTGDMTTGRAWHTATPLGDGTVLMVGTGLAAVSTSAELYDPDTGTFSRTGNLTMGRLNFHTATLLLDGTVLIAGGHGDVNYISLASAELYKPSVPVPAPLLFALSGGCQGQGAIWHAATGQAASANNPAIAGEALSMYTTSLVHAGVVPPQVATGGRLAEILFFGDAPGYPGYYQVNFRVPDGVAPGPAIPVRLNYLGRSSNEVTLSAVKE